MLLQLLPKLLLLRLRQLELVKNRLVDFYHEANFCIETEDVFLMNKFLLQLEETAGMTPEEKLAHQAAQWSAQQQQMQDPDAQTTKYREFSRHHSEPF
jgi:hypothetical protein